MTVATAKSIKKLFVEWNGWGPPASEYEIGEYCRENSDSEYDYEFSFNILMEWMNES